VITPVEAWLAQRRARSGLRVERITRAECREWQLCDGELRHISGRYFQVIGATARTPDGVQWEQPILRQEEVGILGFIVRGAGETVEWLVQAKTEPGNVGGTQAAPTVQATESNYQRVHGGAPTRYLEWFLERGPLTRRTDLLASEHGSRFLRKKNRNMLVIDGDGPEAAEGWRWVSAADVRALLGRDFHINTDARSVIVSSPWELIAAARSPFARWRGTSSFYGRLFESYGADRDATSALELLEKVRAESPPGASEVPLQSLRGWSVLDSGIEPTKGESISIPLIAVQAADREVRHWAQPILAQPSTLTCDLVCEEREGILRFLLKPTWEPGLIERVEFGPSRISVGTSNDGSTDQRVHLSVFQSDEGGRLLECVTRYRVVERRANSNEAAKPEDGVWLTLGQLETLAGQPATLNNEARSAISLLLSVA
jgi:oxidase EvaA